MDTGLSDFYMSIALRVEGKNLDPRATNPLLVRYNELLRKTKIEERRADGKTIKAWIQNIDNYQHELVDKDTLLCSRRIRWTILNPISSPYSRSQPQANYLHALHVKLHQALMKISVEGGKGYYKKIVIQTVNTHVPGDTRTGRWPEEKENLFRAMI